MSRKLLEFDMKFVEVSKTFLNISTKFLEWEDQNSNSKNYLMPPPKQKKGTGNQRHGAVKRHSQKTHRLRNPRENSEKQQQQQQQKAEGKLRKLKHRDPDQV